MMKITSQSVLGTVVTAADIQKGKINENSAKIVHVWIPSTSPHAKNKERVAVLNSWEINFAMTTTMCAGAIGMVVIAAAQILATLTAPWYVKFVHSQPVRSYVIGFIPLQR